MSCLDLERIAVGVCRAAVRARGNHFTYLLFLAQYVKFSRKNRAGSAVMLLV